MITYKTLINSSIININSQLHTLKYNCKLQYRKELYISILYLNIKSFVYERAF